MLSLVKHFSSNTLLSVLLSREEMFPSNMVSVARTGARKNGRNSPLFRNSESVRFPFVPERILSPRTANRLPVRSQVRSTSNGKTIQFSQLYSCSGDELQ